jgi:hypothetical protein
MEVAQTDGAESCTDPVEDRNTFYVTTLVSEIIVMDEVQTSIIFL